MDCFSMFVHWLPYCVIILLLKDGVFLTILENVPGGTKIIT